MKALIEVRSISASISAWVARIAPRTISSVTGSQTVASAGNASAVRFSRSSMRGVSIEVSWQQPTAIRPAGLDRPRMSDLQHRERLALGDLLLLGDQDGFHHPGAWRRHRDLHLHGFEDDQVVVSLD